MPCGARTRTRRLSGHDPPLISPVSLPAIAALALAACGGGSGAPSPSASSSPRPTTSARTRARSSTRSRRRRSRPTSPTTATRPARSVEGAKKLKDLDPPQRHQKDFDTFASAAERQKELASELADAAKSSDQAKIRTILTQAEGATAKGKAAATRIGLKECGKGPDALPGLERHPHARAVLEAALGPGGTPSHAYLFHGPAGTGKRAVARELAAVAADRGRGRSRRARARVEHDTHPDLTWVTPSGAHEMLVGDIEEPVVAAATARRSRRGAACSSSSTPTRSSRRRPTSCSRRSRSRALRAPHPPDRPARRRDADDRLPLPARALRPARRRAARRAARAPRRPARGRAACARLALGNGDEALALALGDGPALRAAAEGFARARAWEPLLAAAARRGDPVRDEVAARAAEATGARARPRQEEDRNALTSAPGAPSAAPRRPGSRSACASPGSGSATWSPSGSARPSSPTTSTAPTPSRRRGGADPRPSSAAPSSSSRRPAPASPSTSPRRWPARRSPTASSDAWRHDEDRGPHPRRARHRAGRGARGRARGRGATRDPRRRRAAGGHDAHARGTTRSWRWASSTERD